MDKDRMAGSAKDFAGKVEGAVGDIAGDAKTQAAGRAREATGTVQNLYGHAKDAALLIAGGIGFALALLMTRSPRRPPPRWRYYG
jgi:uncharacterized protein YjbJ (UPF0337 family)